MPILYEISPSLDLIYLAGFGHCTGKEIFDAGIRAVQDPHYRLDMPRLVDFQRVKEMDITLDQLQLLAQTSKQLEGSSSHQPRKAAVVARNVTDELIGKLYNTYIKQTKMDVQIFYTLTEALHWLDRSDILDDVLALKDSVARRYAASTS